MTRLENIIACTDEVFTEAIREFPALYNKNEKSYKDKNVVQNAWAKVIEKCSFDGNEEEVKNRFSNLKKRRKKAKGASGSGALDVQSRIFKICNTFF